MSRLLVLFSVVAVALAAPQQLFTGFNPAGSQDARPNAWGAERTTNFEEPKLAPVGRALNTGRNDWQSHGDAHFMNKDAGKAIAKILVHEYKIVSPGVYRYVYETDDGVEAEQHANTRGDVQVVEGAYSYVAPSGEKIAVQYMADETGFHAKGDHIHPTPEAILRSLEYNAAHPEENMEKPGQEWSAARNPSVARTAWKSEESAAAVPETVSKVEPAPWEKPAGQIESASGRLSFESAGRALDSAPTAEGVTITQFSETKTVGGFPGFAAQTNYPSGQRFLRGLKAPIAS